MNKQEIKFLAERVSGIEARAKSIEQDGGDILNATGLREDTGFQYAEGSNKAYFNGSITRYTENFARKMMEDMKDHDEVYININSPGGVAQDGISLCNYFAECDKEIIMTATGQAYSAASTMFMGGDKRRIAPGGTVGIHRSWTRATGNEGDMGTVRKELQRMDKQLMDVYASRAIPLKLGDVKKLMIEDTALSAQEAVDLGLADEIITHKVMKEMAREQRELEKATAKTRKKKKVSGDSTSVNEVMADIGSVRKSIAAGEEDPEDRLLAWLESEGISGEKATTIASLVRSIFALMKTAPAIQNEARAEAGNAPAETETDVAPPEAPAEAAPAAEPEQVDVLSEPPNKTAEEVISAPPATEPAPATDEIVTEEDMDQITKEMQAPERSNLPMKKEVATPHKDGEAAPPPAPAPAQAPAAASKDDDAPAKSEVQELRDMVAQTNAALATVAATLASRQAPVLNGAGQDDILIPELPDYLTK